MLNYTSVCVIFLKSDHWTHHRGRWVTICWLLVLDSEFIEQQLQNCWEGFFWGSTKSPDSSDSMELLDQ